MTDGVVFYSILDEINRLFIENYYLPNMVTTQNRWHNKIVMTYTNRFDYSKVFKIDIQDKTKICTRVPLSTINYYFCTTHYCIADVLSFLQLHVCLQSNYFRHGFL